MPKHWQVSFSRTPTQGLRLPPSAWERALLCLSFSNCNWTNTEVNSIVFNKMEFMEIGKFFSGDKCEQKEENKIPSNLTTCANIDNIWGACSFVFVCFIYKDLHQVRWRLALRPKLPSIRNELGWVLAVKEEEISSSLRGCIRQGSSYKHQKWERREFFRKTNGSLHNW